MSEANGSKPTGKPTPASQWKRRAVENQTKVVLLPSGNEIEVLVPTPLDLLRGRGLPNPLAGNVARIVDLVLGNQGQVPMTTLHEMLGMYDTTEALCCYLAVRPRITPRDQTPHGEDEIPVDWLDENDIAAIIQQVIGGAADAAPFPAEAGGDHLDRPDGAALPPASE